MRITRIVITIYGLLFAVLGVGFWTAPQFFAQRFNIEALNVSGFDTVRADLGGLFLTLSALCLVGLWQKRRSLLIAAALMLGSIAAGRLIGWAVSGDLTGLRVTLPVEIGCIVALSLHVRGLKPWADEQKPTRLGRGLLIGGGVAVALAGLAAVTVLTPAVQQAMFVNFTRKVLARDNSSLLGDDALRVALCGTSSPLPSHDRAKACVAVMAGGKFYIVDAGPESVENLMEWGIPLERVGGVLVTHFHSDHIGDLGELNLQTWVAGRPAPLAVYGGPGVEQVVAGFNQAYAQDQGYRSTHHTPQLLPPAAWPMVAHPVAMPATATPGQPRTAVVLDDGQMKITAILTDHAPVEPAYAYRFDYKGRSVVITGDTKAYAPLAIASRGADILLSEAIARPMIKTMETEARAAGRPRVAHIMADIQSYHISPAETADLANKAGVKLLVLYHLIPAPDNFVAKKLFARGLNGARHGEWDMADDGSLYTLPIGSTSFRIGRVPE